MATQVYHNLACCYHITGDIKNAEKYFLLGLTKEPNSSIYCEYGHYLYLHKRYKEAIEILEIAVSLEKDNHQLTYVSIGRMLIDEDLQKEVERDKEITFDTSLLARFLLVKCCHAFEQNNKAVQWLTELEKNAAELQNPLIFRLVGYCYLCLDNEARASNYFNGAKQISAEQHEALKEVHSNPVLSENIETDNEEQIHPETQQEISRELTEFVTEYSFPNTQLLDDDEPPPLEDEDESVVTFSN